MRCGPRVPFHRRFFTNAITACWITWNAVAQPCLPLRIEFFGALRSHPRGESLIQPKVIPPGHCDEIAKPHVRGLVGDHLIDTLFRFHRGVSRIEQEPRLVVGDAAPVLHRSTKPPWNGNMVELGEWVGQAKVIVVVSENLLRTIERVTTPTRLAHCRDDG